MRPYKLPAFQVYTLHFGNIKTKPSDKLSVKLEKAFSGRGAIPELPVSH